MMKRKECIFYIVLLIILNIILAFNLYNNRQNIDIRLNEIKTNIENEKHYYNRLKKRMFLSHKYESDSLYNDIKLGNSKCYLILRYPKLACSTCMDSLLYFLSNSFSSREHTNNLIIIADGTHQAYINQFRRLVKIHIPRIIETTENMQILPLDSLGVPYFFILSNNKCKNIFIPEKDKPLETKEYISIIRQKFFLEN